MQIFRVKKPSCKILKTKNCVPVINSFRRFDAVNPRWFITVHINGSLVRIFKIHVRCVLLRLLILSKQTVQTYSLWQTLMQCCHSLWQTLVQCCHSLWQTLMQCCHSLWHFIWSLHCLPLVVIYESLIYKGFRGGMCH